MKKYFFPFIALAALTALFASTGPASAYTVTGDLKTAGAYTLSATGSLWSVLSGTGKGIANSKADYILVTGAGGSLATFSAGEINTSLYSTGASTVNISSDSNGDGGYTVSGDGQTITNVSNINVVRAPLPAGTYPGGASAAFTVYGPGIATTTYTPSSLPQTDTITASGMENGKTPYTWTYTGVSLVSLLQSAGVNTNNLNQLVIAVGNDGYQITMSMGQIVAAGNLDMVADMSNDTSAPLYYDSNGNVVNGAFGFARTILGNQNSNGQWDQMLQKLEVVPTPVPPSALLLVPGLLGLFGIKKRFM